MPYNALVDAEEWHLAVAGRGDDAAYRQFAANSGVVERLHLLGVVSDAPMLYHAADAFVLPTSYETFSLVTYEAAASGLPLLATAVSGIEDLLVDGVTGFRITYDSPQIAARLRQLVRLRGWRCRLELKRDVQQPNTPGTRWWRATVNCTERRAYSQGSRGNVVV